MKVSHTTHEDLDEIFSFFDASITYQEAKGYPVWRNYDKAAIRSDTDTKKQYKVVFENEIAIVFSVCYTDKIIWRELDDQSSVYLHRIVVNPKFKGRRLFQHILDWCSAHCKEKGLRSIRMDTWAANTNIIEYYKGFGFTVIENFLTPETPLLPVHNRNLELTLLEYQLP